MYASVTSMSMSMPVSMQWSTVNTDPNADATVVQWLKPKYPWKAGIAEESSELLQLSCSLSQATHEGKVLHYRSWI